MGSPVSMDDNSDTCFGLGGSAFHGLRVPTGDYGWSDGQGSSGSTVPLSNRHAAFMDWHYWRLSGVAGTRMRLIL